MTEIPLKFAIWLVINIIGAALIYFCFRKYWLKCNPNLTCWGKWIVFQYDQTRQQYYFQLTCGADAVNFTPFQRFYDMLLTLHHSWLLFYYADVVNRIHIDQAFNLVYLIPFYVIIPLFAFIGDLQGMQFSISPSSLSNLSIQAKITVIMLIVGLSSLIGYHIYLSYLADILAYYVIGIIAFPMLYAIVYWLYLKTASGAAWHIHHWWIGFYFSLICRFDNVISNIAFMCFYGIFLQGALSFGVTPIITGPSRGLAPVDGLPEIKRGLIEK